MTHSSLQDIVCCLGQPVAGNPAQYMMEKAIAAAGLDLRFLTLEVAPDRLDDALRGMRAMGFRGAFVLSPHQAAAMQHMDELSPAAHRTGIVTMVDRKGERLIGDNTIGKGLLRLVRQSVDLTGRQVVILGAGRAARSVAIELALAGAGELVIVNRTAERAQELVALVCQQMGAAARFVHWVGPFLPLEETALVVQATTLGTGDAPAEIPLDLSGLAPSAIVVDMRVNPLDARFLREASARSLVALDGLDVMVMQAAIAFNTWTGVEPDQLVMHEAVEEFLML